MIHKEARVGGGGQCVSVRSIEDTFRNRSVETGVGQPTCLTFCHVMTVAAASSKTGPDTEQVTWTQHGKLWLLLTHLEI